MTHPTEDAIPSSEPERRVPTRRTILAGAAWSIPVISLAAAAPARAASVIAPTLTFLATEYPAETCDSSPEMKVQLTRDGLPSAGEFVLVSLPAGSNLTWADAATGAHSFGPTAADGTATIPAGAITTAAPGGQFSLTAQSSDALVSASTTLQVDAPAGAANLYRQNINTDGTASGGATQLTTTGNVTAITTQQNSSTTMAFLADGDLFSENGSLIASDVTAFDSLVDFEGNRYALYSTTGGIFRQPLSSSGALVGGPATISSSVTNVVEIHTAGNGNSVAGMRTSDGRLYLLLDPLFVQIASGVSTFDANVTSTGQRVLFYATSSGIYSQNVNTGGAQGAPQLLITTTGAASAIHSQQNGNSTLGYLVNGTLYTLNGTVVANNVSAFDAQVGFSGQRQLLYTTPSGVFTQNVTSTGGVSGGPTSPFAGSAASDIDSAANGGAAAGFVSDGRLYAITGVPLTPPELYVTAMAANVDFAQQRKFFYAAQPRDCA